MKLVYAAYPEAVRAADVDGWLPVHVLLSKATFESESDEATDKLRFLLKEYPESVAKLTTPRSNRNRPTSPYLLSRDKNEVVRRLVLRAMPSLNPQEHAELNYAARRMGLFLGTAAAVVEGEQSIFNRLRENDESLFKRVVIFL